MKQSEKEDVEAYLIQLKELHQMNVQELKNNQDLVKAYASNRHYDQNKCLQATKDILAEYRVHRQAFTSRNFIGPHGRKLMANHDDIIDKISEKLKEHCHRDVSHEDIDSYSGKVKSILASLDAICHIIKSASEDITGDRLILLEKQIDKLSELWRLHPLSVTTKMHILECHVLDYAKDLNRLGLLGEEPIERTHK